MQTKKHSIGKVRSWSARPTLHALTLLAAMGLASHAHAAVRYSVTDLGTLYEWTRSVWPPTLDCVTGINNAGQVVGWSIIFSMSFFHAFVTVDGVMTDLGTLGGL